MESKSYFIQGALCYAELGCAYVSSGGDYTYLRVAFGNFPGFLRVWIEVVLSRPMIVVLSVLTASNYLVYWFYPTCPPPDALVKCLSSFLLLIVGFINLISAVWTNRLHQICNYFKIGMKKNVIEIFILKNLFFLASLLIVIGAGLYRMIRGRIENFAEPFESSTYGKLPSALYAGLFPYAGW
jgi:L-type amino acid transporter 9